ncbi:hypothetical protein F53441_7845 [Fusarium austroafricanum]|uniref:Uncharacterized protein n=1 Tax=Fusarium austroafricanum TaxID=2364996 RepID=A0A8H4KFC7_9HYPO|nr:hypothetical protein F53441_7845 [Fusarium austroafricanum]
MDSSDGCGPEYSNPDWENTIQAECTQTLNGTSQLSYDQAEALNSEFGSLFDVTQLNSNDVFNFDAIQTPNGDPLLNYKSPSQDSTTMGNSIFSEFDKEITGPDTQPQQHSHSAKGSSIAPSSAVRESSTTPVDPALYQNDQYETVCDQKSPISALIFNSGVSMAPPDPQQQPNTMTTQAVCRYGAVSSPLNNPVPNSGSFMSPRTRQQQLGITTMQPGHQQLQPTFEPGAMTQANNPAMMMPRQNHQSYNSPVHGQAYPDSNLATNWTHPQQRNFGGQFNFVPPQSGYDYDSPRPMDNSYQPFYSYPLDGINGNMSGYRAPRRPTLARLQGQPMPNPAEISQCLSCGCRPHTGQCPQPQFMHPAAYAPQPGRQSLPKRKWSATEDEGYEILPPAKVGKKSPPTDDDSDEIEPPAKTGKRTSKGNQRTTTRRGRSFNPEDVYWQFRAKDLDWISPNGYEFKYKPEGQWKRNVLLSARALKDYLENCPRENRVIWLQNTPAQCNSRMDFVDHMCRYEDCPLPSKNIINGWFRVVFDEHSDLTSNGTKDPFKVAGAMHLWCFEQCLDPAETLRTGEMVPDDRVHKKERGKNPMAITRDNNSKVIQDAIEPWLQARLNLPPNARRIPFDPHEKSLSYRLMKHHLDTQSICRQASRTKRQEEKPKGKRSLTQDIHMGDLDYYVQLSNEAKAEKEAATTKRATSFRPVARRQPYQPHSDENENEPPQPCTTKESSSAQESSRPQLTPNGSTVDFAKLLDELLDNVSPPPKKVSTAPYANDSDQLSSLPKKNLATPPVGTDPGLPGADVHQRFMDQQRGVIALPKIVKAPKEEPTTPLRRSVRLSAGNIAEAAVQSEDKIEPSPKKAPAHRLPTPGDAEDEIQDEIQVASSPSNGTVSPLGQDDALFGANTPVSDSPSKNQGGRWASRNAGDEAQGSPLRRSSRQSSKKSP